jgi:tripartite ATP-independent transporter DctP family solute receptor
MKSLLSYVFICIVLSACVEPGIAKEEFIIKYSHAGPADPTMQSSSGAAVVFKHELEKLGKGRIRVDVYPSGQLGSLRSSVHQVRKGTIHICDISSGVLASLYYPPLEILDLPYVLSSRASAMAALDSSNPVMKKLIEQCAEKTGIRVLSLAPFGFRNMSNNVRPIRTPAEMKGLKVRTMEIVAHRKLMESFGARAMPIPWLELYTSLQTNVIDGEETTPQNMIMGKIFQVQKYLTLTNHLMGVGAILCNEQWYQSLPDDIRSNLLEAQSVARDAYNRFGEYLDAIALEKLKSRMEVYEPTAEQMQMFRDAAVPYMRKYMEDRYGQELVTEFLTAAEAAEKLARQAEGSVAKEGKYDFETLWGFITDQPPEKISEKK